MQFIAPCRLWPFSREGYWQVACPRHRTIAPRARTPYIEGMEHGSSSCCTPSPASAPPSCHGDHEKRRVDYLLWASLLLVAVGYVVHLTALSAGGHYMAEYADATYTLMNKMWWGLVLGILFVGLLGRVPREMVMAVIGKPGTLSGILRATLAGVLLDLCSHGILLVGMKLYERGAGLGQVMAFLIASPWNSLSLTVILAALVGWPWTLLFIAASMGIALVSGVIFNMLVRRGTLPANPHYVEMPEDYKLLHDIKRRLSSVEWNAGLAVSMAKEAVIGSRMILRWIFFGVVLAALIRTFVPPDHFGTLFGPSLAGLGLTLAVATVLEICSEGSTPIAADILTRAAAPGNAFAFLMAGVATDYTEVMALKETTRSWKIALFLPLVTLPQVIILAVVMNLAG